MRDKTQEQRSSERVIERNEIEVCTVIHHQSTPDRQRKSQFTHLILFNKIVTYELPANNKFQLIPLICFSHYPAPPPPFRRRRRRRVVHVADSRIAAVINCGVSIICEFSNNIIDCLFCHFLLQPYCHAASYLTLRKSAAADA